jgi:hypothetical protein
MLTFKPGFFVVGFVLFVIEVLIALYVRDSIVRPYVGDFLVVIMIYCFVRAFLKAAPWKIGVGVLLFSFTIETLQYFNIVDRLGLSNNPILKTVIGYGFEWLDILAYTLGIAMILTLEYLFRRRSSRDFA